MENRETTSSQPIGAYVGGNITAQNVTITVNPSSSMTSQVTRTPPFRFNIPTPTRHFKGRQNTLEDVRNYFTKLPKESSDCWDRIVAIVGLGGMGKTETAYKFAAQYKDIFPNVAWINAETEQSALASFLGLAKHLALVPKDTVKADLCLVNDLYCHIDKEDYGSVLFIFDNAIQLNSDGGEFGILEYLPTNELPNQRFPNILITTQTHDWGRQISTFQIDELSGEESLEFFHNCFRIESPECDELFTNLHELLQGYPLVMNLVASQIDFNPKKDSAHHLQKQIHRYIKTLEKEDSKILSAKMNRVWPTKYNKTLSTVWQLTFERLEQEEDGHDALELLQVMSLLRLPIECENVEKMLVHSSDCPHPEDQELHFRMRECVRLLERFYAVRILKEDDENEEKFCCQVGVHRLVQLVVRQPMDSSKAVQVVLRFLAQPYSAQCRWYYRDYVNLSALEEVLLRTQLSPLAWFYVGVLACKGLPGARKIVETRQPEIEAAVPFWHLYNLERGVTVFNEHAIKVFKNLVGLAKSCQRVMDRKCFSFFILKVLQNQQDEMDFREQFHGVDEEYREFGETIGKGSIISITKTDNGYNEDDFTPVYFRLDNFDGIADLVAELIFNFCSMVDQPCQSLLCMKGRNLTNVKGLATLAVKLSWEVPAVSSKPSIAVEQIADMWLAILAWLKSIFVQEERIPPDWTCFWETIYELLHSPKVSQSIIAELRTCMWDNGLATELISLFKSTSCLVQCQTFDIGALGVLECMEYCLEGMYLKDERVQQVIPAFLEMMIAIDAAKVPQNDEECQIRDVLRPTIFRPCRVFITFEATELD